MASQRETTERTRTYDSHYKKYQYTTKRGKNTKKKKLKRSGPVHYEKWLCISATHIPRRHRIPSPPLLGHHQLQSETSAAQAACTCVRGALTHKNKRDDRLFRSGGRSPRGQAWLQRCHTSSSVFTPAAGFLLFSILHLFCPSPPVAFAEDVAVHRTRMCPYPATGCILLVLQSL